MLECEETSNRIAYQRKTLMIAGPPLLCFQPTRELHFQSRRYLALSIRRPFNKLEVAGLTREEQLYGQYSLCRTVLISYADPKNHA